MDIEPKETGLVKNKPLPNCCGLAPGLNCNNIRRYCGMGDRPFLGPSRDTYNEFSAFFIE
jgi:hypothetical protein